MIKNLETGVAAMAQKNQGIETMYVGVVRKDWNEERRVEEDLIEFSTNIADKDKYLEFNIITLEELNDLIVTDVYPVNSVIKCKEGVAILTEYLDLKVLNIEHLEDLDNVTEEELEDATYLKWDLVPQINEELDKEYEEYYVNCI